jgi:hypothetical protein
MTRILLKFLRLNSSGSFARAPKPKMEGAGAICTNFPIFSSQEIFIRIRRVEGLGPGPGCLKIRRRLYPSSDFVRDRLSAGNFANGRFQIRFQPPPTSKTQRRLYTRPSALTIRL